MPPISWDEMVSFHLIDGKLWDDEMVVDEMVDDGKLWDGKLWDEKVDEMVSCEMNEMVDDGRCWDGWKLIIISSHLISSYFKSNLN